MKKLAVFVEGQTEQLALEKLLIEIFGKNNIRIDKREANGKTGARRFLVIDGHSIDNGEEYYALIVNSQGDSTVKSDILDRYSRLVQEGYDLVIGVRDVFPLVKADLPALKSNLYKYVKTKPLRICLILATMEIEAWFLAEELHYNKIDENLSTALIQQILGFHPALDDMELRDHPAKDLHDAYALVGKAYTKKKLNTLRTIDAIDWANFYAALPGRLPSLAELINCLNQFAT